ncbi:uromodulin-like, partial [Hyperolius riggenbachi]|uniref:uromodulin-like n=1 Tax=Hyperolius riggenbachi TaxID=752182 RepID=UPI0035A34397
MKLLLVVLYLTICVHLSWAEQQVFTSYAKSCNYCNSTTSANCAENSGYVTCSCKSGFVGSGLNCTRMSFCGTSNCCPDGYTWDTKQKLCVDIDECASPTLNKCSPTETCVNKNGIYLCTINRKAPCGDTGASPCSSDQSCIPINGDLQCADPCFNYKEVNGANRLATISSSGRFSTDRNIVGWIRYVGDGLSLKEGCVGVGPLKCGSLEPYTLREHPKIGDGITMVPLMTNSLSGKCSPGPNIAVKACPGGYYVYKYSGLLKFDVYCTGESLPGTPDF